MPPMQTLHRYLAKQKMTQSELAAALGIDKGYMSRLLNGSRTPSLRVARQLSKLTGISLEKLVEDIPIYSNSAGTAR